MKSENTKSFIHRTRIGLRFTGCQSLHGCRKIIGTFVLGMICAGTLSADSPIDNSPTPASALDGAQHSTRLLDLDNLVAWCIVPFDAQRRTPAQRAEMLVELGIRSLAYDWREEHVSTFEDEILQCQEHGIELLAFWGQHDHAFQLFQQYDLHPQIWQIIGDPGGESDTKVQRAAEALVPLAQRTEALKLPLGLYNHMGWDGQPENMVAVCQRLHAWGYPHVGIVYNFHHGHDHIQGWSESLRVMLPYLMCVNINGMNPGAEPKILAVGKGQHEREMIETLLRSNYRGPIGIIDHQPEVDARQALQENLAGLTELKKHLPTNLGNTSAAFSSDRFEPQYRSDFVSRQLAAAGRLGDARRGAAVFGSDQTACVSCHAVKRPELQLSNAEEAPVLPEQVGGQVGPDLQRILRSRTPEQIVESLYWPEREIDAKYRLWQVLTVDGAAHSGYWTNSDDQNASIQLKEISTGLSIELDRQEVELVRPMGTAMPTGLCDRLSPLRQLDLIRFLLELREKGGVSPQDYQTIASAPQHGVAKFPFELEPVDPDRWPDHRASVNRDRIYDFYTKQAEYFRSLPSAPLLLQTHPGLDSGRYGHWGNQNEATWASDAWNATMLGSMQSGVFRAGQTTVPRGICVQLGSPAELNCCYDPDTLTYPAIWKGGFVKFSSVRHGFLDGLQMAGELVESNQVNGLPEDQSGLPRRYLGMMRIGDRVVFVSSIGHQIYWDSPWVENGKFVNELALAENHSLRDAVSLGGPDSWPDPIRTRIESQSFGPFEIDTIQLPEQNPWRSLMYISGHAMDADGSAWVCTMQGDVWHVTGLQPGSTETRWKRFASGLHQPLGLWVDQDGLFVQCRDQLVMLLDFNVDDHADYYLCLSNAFQTSPAGHDFICGLQRDSEGNFYTASGNQGLLKIASHGRSVEVIATGFRNPDGLGILQDQTLTVPCSEGDWSPASMICAVPSKLAAGQTTPPHFGYPGRGGSLVPELPLCYLPRGLDNSSGDQTVVPDKNWGPLEGKMLHLSFGTGSWFVVLIDQVEGQRQGAVVPMAGEFLSGAHRGRFSPADGHFYVSGMTGWGTYTSQVGCFQRVRCVNTNYQQPVGFHVHRNGIVVNFAMPVDSQVALKRSSHFAQSWNYRYSGAYGSPEFSPSHPGVEGHDVLAVTSVHQVDSKSIFLEVPDLQSVSQLHLRMHVNESTEIPSASPVGSGHDMYLTVHRLDSDFTQYPNYHELQKAINPHPILRDLANQQPKQQNRWSRPIKGARQIEVRTGKNLTYETSELRVVAGEAIQIKLENVDVVPHNWVLIEPGRLSVVGDLVNRLIASPDAYARHYIPDSPDVLAYTDIVPAGASQSIYFHAPTKPGRYPFLCTFPGHWMVMNGVMVVD